MFCWKPQNTSIIIVHHHIVVWCVFQTTQKQKKIKLSAPHCEYTCFRIRGAAICQHGDARLLATASSDGVLQLWRVTCEEVSEACVDTFSTGSVSRHRNSYSSTFLLQGSWSSEKLVSHDTKFRLTCLAMTLGKMQQANTAGDETQPADDEQVVDSSEDEVSNLKLELLFQ